ncbi:hypothetical protein [Paenirhodobacter enshiensis]|uniref:hypothetical protein n=1 Tax=Paenirhodobacter enshiensis TaxID=1105367 RepID=UPI003FA23AD7
MHDSRRDEDDFSIVESDLPAVDTDLRGAGAHEEHLCHLVVTMRRDRPVMQAGPVADPFAMDDVREGPGFAEQIEDGDLRRTDHA